MTVPASPPPDLNPIVIVGNIAPTYIGGLSINTRALATAMTEASGTTGIFLALKAKHPTLPANPDPLPWPLITLPAVTNPLAFRSFWPSLASRPSLHFLLEKWVDHAWKFPDHLQPSVIHFFGTGWDYFGFALADYAKKCGARFTIMPAVHPGQWGDDAIDIRLYRKADAIVCLSEFERSHLMSLGVPAETLFCCGLFPMNQPNGNAVGFREKHALGNRPCVLFIGRPDSGKGYPALQEAWKIVVTKTPDAVLLLVGPRPQETDAGSSDSVRSLGVIDEMEKADALAACDIFCLPSAHESFGIVYLEAWSYSKPVICGTAAASRELVEDGVTGRWADQDPATLAARICELLQNPEERKRLGENGKRLQETKFTEHIFQQRHREIFGLQANSNAPRS